MESKWQLMTNIITYQQFNDWAFLTNSFYTNDFLTISPDKNTIDIYGKTKINITYDKSNKNIVFSFMFCLGLNCIFIIKL